MPNSTTQTPILVLVHPGSCCGSANDNLGKYEARAFRDQLADELNQWNGGIIVIGGALSDELPYYPALRDAIRDCRARAKKNGLVSSEYQGCDDVGPGPAIAIKRALSRLKPPLTTPFHLTGAWYDPSDRTGCVNSVHDVLREQRRPVDLLDSVFELDFLESDENDTASL